MVTAQPATGGERPRMRPLPTTLAVLRQAFGMKELGAIVALIVTVAFFSAMSGNFLTAATLSNVAIVTAQYGIIAIGVTFLMIAGELDLTTGAMFALIPMIMGNFFVNEHWPLLGALAISLVAAAGIGLLNGLLTVFLRIPSFIVTLGMMFWWIGLLTGLSAGAPVSYSSTPTTLLNIMGGPTGGPNSLYWPDIWYLVLLVIGIYALEFTRWGNAVFAVGSSPVAARSMGVRVNRVKITCFVISAVLAGFAGCLIFGYQLSASPSQGTDFELYAIVATVVGGTSLFGGRGSVLGSLFGAAIIAAASSGLVLIGAPSAWYEAFVGFVLIVALAVNTQITGSKLRSLFVGGPR